MAIYLIIFFIASSIYFIAEKTYKINRFFSYSAALIGTLIVSIFSGIRSYSVGTDVLVYGNNIFLDSVVYPFSTVVERNERWADLGYVLFNWVVAHFTGSPQLFYGVLTFVTTILVYMIFYFYKKNLSITFAMFSFLMILWPLHLNILRQGLAMSLLGVELYLIDRKKYASALIIAVVGYFIHDSSILISAIFIACKFLIVYFKKRGDNATIKVILIMVVAACSIPFILNFIPTSLMTDFDPKYYYVSNSFSIDQFSFSRALLFAFPLIYYTRRVVKLPDENDESLLLMYTIGVLNIIFNGFAISNYILFGRLSYYFYIPFIIFLSKSIALTKDWKLRLLEYLIWSIYVIYIFFELLYLRDYGGLFPYEVDRMVRILFSL